MNKDVSVAFFKKKQKQRLQTTKKHHKPQQNSSCGGSKSKLLTCFHTFLLESNTFTVFLPWPRCFISILIFYFFSWRTSVQLCQARKLPDRDYCRFCLLAFGSVFWGTYSQGVSTVGDSWKLFSIDLSFWSVLDSSVVHGSLLKLLFLSCLFYPVLKSCDCVFGSWVWRVSILDLVLEGF